MNATSHATGRDLVVRFWLPLCCAVVVFGALVLRNSWVLSRPTYEHSDYAANSLLIDKAAQLRLLIGNYSRFRFNHPGPALLYVQAAGQVIAYRVLHVVPSPFNGQMLGLFGLQALGFALIARTVQRNLQSTVATAVFVATLLFMTSGRVSAPVQIASAWPPWLLDTPVLLALVSGASVAKGELADLPTFTFATGLLWHLHATFVGLVTVSVLAVALIVWATHRGRIRELAQTYRRAIVAAVVIEALFLLPVVLELLLHFPGSWGAYLSYARRPAGTHHSLSAMLGYVWSFWGRGQWTRIAFLILGLAGVVLALKEPSRSVRGFVLALFGAAMWATALMMGYALHGVDHYSTHYVYEGYWYMVVPALAVATAAAALTVRLSAQRRALPVSLVAVAALLVLGLSSGSTQFPYAGVGWLPGAVRAANLDALRAGRTIGLTFPADSWPEVTGLLEQARRTHVAMCVENPSWGFMMTSSEICSPAKRSQLWRVYLSPESRRPPSETHTIFRAPGTTLSAE